MSDINLVEGDGWISDESDFYGDDKMQMKLERNVARGLKRRSETPFAGLVAKKAKTEPRPIASSAPSPSPAATVNSKPTDNVLDFLRSRPQVTAMQKGHSMDLIPSKKQPSRNAAGEEAADLSEDNRFRGDPAAWQKDEAVEAFLRRAPVADPETACFGPWLWVGNPKIKYAQRKHEQKTDVGAFTEAGELLLQAFQVQRAKIEQANEGKAVGTITRYMRPYREQLEDDLLQLAVKTGTTCGKWMLFPKPDVLPRTWRLIAEATAVGKLGPTSKVATHDPNDPKDERVICVYTYDFTDTDDVRRVLNELVDLDVVSRDGKAIYYKCDAYTYLDIKSENPYKIRASLYSSKEMLGVEVKAKDGGPIVRLKKRNGTIDSFPST